MMGEQQTKGRRRVLVLSPLHGSDLSDAVDAIKNHSAFSESYNFEFLKASDPIDYLKRMGTNYDFVLCMIDAPLTALLRNMVGAFLSNEVLLTAHLVGVTSMDTARTLEASAEIMWRDPPDRVCFFTAALPDHQSIIEDAVAHGVGKASVRFGEARVPISMEDAAIGIFHLSDLHATWWNRDLQSAVLKDLEQFRSWAKERALVVSGDLSNFGRRPEMRAARGFLFRACEIAHVARDKMYVCPGNHDSTARFYGVSIPFLQRKLVAFRDLFPGPFRCSPDTYSSFTELTVNRDMTVGLLIIDSTGKGSWARGRVNPKTLDWIREVSADFRERHYGGPLIVLVHHHVLKHDFVPFKREHVTQMENSALFLTNCQRCGVDLVLHGHQHLAWEADIATNGKYGQITAVIPAGSATCRRWFRAYHTQYNRIALTPKGFVVESRSYNGHTFQGAASPPKAFRRP